MKNITYQICSRPSNKKNSISPINSFLYKTLAAARKKVNRHIKNVNEFEGGPGEIFSIWKIELIEEVKPQKTTSKRRK